MNIAILTATASDIAGVLAVQKDLLVPPEKLAEADPRQGFLIHPTPESELRSLVCANTGSFLLVARQNADIVGYLIAYRLDDWINIRKEWWNSVQELLRKLEQFDPTQSFYIQHVARKPGSPGAGKLLSDHAIAKIRSGTARWIVGDILTEPVLNEVSARFHELRGFRPIGQYAEANMKWTVYALNLGGPTARDV